MPAKKNRPSLASNLPPPQSPQPLPASLCMPARRSSPVDPAKDDIDLVHDFFTWKIASVTNDKVKDRCARAFRVAQDGLWSIEDLKGISVRGQSRLVRGGELWKYAVDKGIPDGLYREQKYRSQEDAAAGLQALQYNCVV